MNADTDLIDGEIPTAFSDAKTLSREIITISHYGNSFKNQAVCCYCLAKHIQLLRAHCHNEWGVSFTNPEVQCWRGIFIPSCGWG